MIEYKVISALEKTKKYIIIYVSLLVLTLMTFKKQNI